MHTWVKDYTMLVDSVRLRPTRLFLASTLLISVVLVTRGQTDRSAAPQSVADLARLNPAELSDVFKGGSIKEFPVGELNGQMLYLTDRLLPVYKVNTANKVWRGKYVGIGEDASFANRWMGNRRWLGSKYVIGPSWLDGQPAIILEYPIGTPMFANLHDEMREVAPGVLLGTVFERNPRKFRGYFAIEVPRPGSTPKRPTPAVVMKKGK
jgi:hypothetical protein